MEEKTMMEDIEKQMWDILRVTDTWNNKPMIVGKIFSEVTIKIACPDCKKGKFMTFGMKIITCPFCQGSYMRTITLKEAIERLQSE